MPLRFVEQHHATAILLRRTPTASAQYIRITDKATLPKRDAESLASEQAQLPTCAAKGMNMSFKSYAALYRNATP